MQEGFAKQYFNHMVGCTLLVLFIFLITSCHGFNQSSGIEDNFEDYWIVSGVARLYQSRNDISTYEIIDDLWVIKTGRCRKSNAIEGEILCPVKGIYTDQEGWVLEYFLIEFEDYLPHEQD